jgi:hypothetical protein
MIRALAIALALATTAPIVHAQPGPPPAQKRREKIKERIRALRAYTLTEELDLDEATAGKLFPVLSKYDDVFDKLLQQRADLERRLKGVDAIKDPRAIDKLVDEAVANQRAFWDTEAARLTELRKILTPAQTARLLVVLPALERKIQNQLQRAIKAGKAGRSAPDDDGEDDEAGPRFRKPVR